MAIHDTTTVADPGPTRRLDVSDLPASRAALWVRRAGPAAHLERRGGRTYLVD